MLINLYRKLKWVVKNYSEIGFDKKLITNATQLMPTHFLGPITYNTDSLVTSNNCDFIKEERFAKAYKAASNTKPWEGFTLQWRVYIVCWLADKIKNLEGDFVECGVNTGAYSRAIIEYIDFNNLNKTFYLFDTFSGLDAKQITESEQKAGIADYLGNYKDVYQQVKETFSPFNVQIVRGRVPDTLEECKSEKICYLSIDMNVTEPEIAAANYFWDKVVKGGVIILDDYGFPPHINQKLAFDAFAKEKGTSILTLPTGQGVIIK
ncbi:MAG: class I SAM-dependent methyltransferase [Sphingobacteriales bacterium]|nr:class I SAM-dependent methyltransferase [Sphingobacteriales bacterium]MBI3718044.1 class I SAM-dependent methyltransferase [Sphingobacteriales bacterium]